MACQARGKPFFRTNPGISGNLVSMLHVQNVVGLNKKYNFVLFNIFFLGGNLHASCNTGAGLSFAEEQCEPPPSQTSV